MHNSNQNEADNIVSYKLNAIMTAAMMPAVSPVEKEGTSPIYNQGKDVAIYKYSF